MIFTYDPYDIWSTETLGRLKAHYRDNRGALFVPMLLIGVLEIAAPVTLRRLIGLKKNRFPVLEAIYPPEKDELGEKLKFFRESAIKVGEGRGWGMPFRWFSKNGLYDPNTAYATNVTYVMEAMISWEWSEEDRPSAEELFISTWGFWESLNVYVNSETELALSYASVDEPRLVVNANSYSAYAYALHAVHGRHETRKIATAKASRITNWIIRQQDEAGMWLYYADNAAGNFVDCFHTCFVIKNLMKVQRLIPELAPMIEPSLRLGWSFLKRNFYDPEKGLCRRFYQQDQKDPFKWDLYDQAEYLGLLIDFALMDEANAFSRNVEDAFRSGDDWFCRIDILGRKWGKNFMRWGIAPYLNNKARLDEHASL